MAENKKKRKRLPTPKEKAFAQTYVKTGNATEAAMQAYDTHSRNNAAQIGSRALRHPVVREEIEALQRSVQDKWLKIVEETLNHAQEMMLNGDAMQKAWAMKYIQDYHKALGANTEQNKQITHQHLHIPKR